MNPVSVLLVDDEQGFLDAMSKRLGKRGLKVRMAPSGRQALAMLDQEPADVVVLDQKMPDLDGLATLTLIKERHPAVRVIMLTGHATVDSAISGIAMGAFDYLVKPCDLDTLLDQIYASLGRK